MLFRSIVRADSVGTTFPAASESAYVGAPEAMTPTTRVRKPSWSRMEMTPQMPEDLFREFDAIGAMFMEQSGFTEIMAGKGEKNVRGQGHARGPVAQGVVQLRPSGMQRTWGNRAARAPAERAGVWLDFDVNGLEHIQKSNKLRGLCKQKPTTRALL